jgi:trigger factor
MNHMAIAVETLDKLQRRITIKLPVADVRAEVEKRLKQRARTVKAPGFRPGKVPMKMVEAQYGFQIENEVLNDQVGRAFSEAASENKLRVAGYPKIEPKAEAEASAEGTVAFDAIFEVYPDVKIGDLSGAQVEKIVAAVTDAEVDKTVDILRKQRAHFHVKGEQGAHGDGGPEQSAQQGDRVTVDFIGRIDGEEFQGGKAEDFAFVLGEGQMLPEFESGTTGLKLGESRSFPLAFPADYHGKDVAGKTAEFTITLKKLEWSHLPEVDAEFAKSLGIADGDLQKMRADIRANLEREIGNRVKAKAKDAVMDALLKVCELDVPKVLLERETERLMESTRSDMAQRGMNVKDLPFPPDMFTPQAERRVKLGLILAELVKANNLQATPEQIKAQIEEFAKSYEDPQQVVKYYYSDRSRLGEVEALVLEENVVNYALGKAQVTEKTVPFDELMGKGAQA